MRLILLLIGICYAVWEIPTKVIESYKGTESILMDESTGVTHIFWCSDVDNYFHYNTMNPDKSLNVDTTFRWKYPCTKNFQIKAEHDGKNVYLVYQGYRQHGKVIG